MWKLGPSRSLITAPPFYTHAVPPTSRNGPGVRCVPVCVCVCARGRLRFLFLLSHCQSSEAKKRFGEKQCTKMHQMTVPALISDQGELARSHRTPLKHSQIDNRTSFERGAAGFGLGWRLTFCHMRWEMTPQLLALFKPSVVEVKATAAHFWLRGKQNWSYWHGILCIEKTVYLKRTEANVISKIVISRHKRL